MMCLSTDVGMIDDVMCNTLTTKMNPQSMSIAGCNATRAAKRFTQLPEQTHNKVDSIELDMNDD